jgi:GNAT superfamily N-acetyltransferase
MNSHEMLTRLAPKLEEDETAAIDWHILIKGSRKEETLVAWVSRSFPQEKRWNKEIGDWETAPPGSKIIWQGLMCSCHAGQKNFECPAMNAADEIRKAELQQMMREEAFPDDLVHGMPDPWQWNLDIAASAVQWLYHLAETGYYVCNRAGGVLYVQQVARILDWPAPEFWWKVNTILEQRHSLTLNGMIYTPWYDKEPMFKELEQKTGHREFIPGEWGQWSCHACGLVGDVRNDPRTASCVQGAYEYSAQKPSVPVPLPTTIPRPSMNGGLARPNTSVSLLNSLPSISVEEDIDFVIPTEKQHSTTNRETGAVEDYLVQVKPSYEDEVNAIAVIQEMQKDAKRENTNIPYIEDGQEVFWMENSGWRIWVLYIDGTASGLLCVHPPELSDGDRAHAGFLETETWIKEGYRGKGLASAGWDLVEAKLSYDEVPGLVCELWENDEFAQRRVEKHGWSKVGRFKYIMESESDDPTWCDRWEKKLVLEEEPVSSESGFDV